MKNFLFLAAFAFFPAPGAHAGADCSKSADACRPQPVKLTPFMAELKKAEKAPELNREPAEGTPIKAPGSPVSAPAAAAPTEPPAKKETFSRPGWLAAAAALLAGLYYFLKEDVRRKRKK